MTSNAAFNLFVERAHELLQAGYEALDAKACNLWSEPEISGELASKIEQLLWTRRQPWMRYWTAMDNPPENEPDIPGSKRRLGKRRKLPDIKLKYAGQRETLFFRFEAKKLASSGDYTELISDKDGLGRFLRRIYGREDKAGGLLGYVQTETPEAHAARVKMALATDPTKFRVDAKGEWAVAAWKNGPKYSFRVVHSRERASAIVIFYSFLSFR
ncbi:MAG TPA: hypothetical protein PKA41_08650 [Verrucomicrobiota bacterium]|nr:hypothetical protein [Verrucomicrobiota bacterium]